MAYFKPQEASNIRPLRDEDLAQAKLLVEELGYSGTVDELRHRLHRISSSADEGVFGFEQDGAVVGWAHVKVQHSFESEAFVEIMGLVVATEVRRRGVGAALVERAISWAREHGCDRLRVRSNVLRSGAQHFYEALGLQRTKTQHVYDLDLGR
jgi:GNAT superfamily N-acetyltransferase